MMTLLSVAAANLLAPALSLQAAGETAVAIKNDAPETWTVEYPRIITPFIQDYRRCLNVVDRKVTGEANFEIQHRSDLPRCAEVSAESQAEANRVLANRSELADYSPSDVAQVFDHIGRIHVARGADLDAQFTMRMQRVDRTPEDYEQTKPKGLVIELRDASVVKAAVDKAEAKIEDPAK